MQQPSAPGWTIARLAVAVAVTALGALLVVVGLIVVLTRPTPEAAAVPSPSTAASGAVIATPSAAPASPSASAQPSSSAPTSPSPSPSGDPVLVGAGDIALCDGKDDEATAALLERTPGIVYALGDTAYERGSPKEYRECYAPSWGRALDRTRFAAVGNHEYMTEGAAGFKAYFGDAGVRDGVTWFSEDVGAWHVIVLDANCTELTRGCRPDSPQLQWLRDDLAASGARCTLAMWHQPRFSSGQHGNDATVGPFWDALYAAGADLVLNGHDHDYERFAPQNPEGEADAARGITEIIVGTGGAALREFDRLVPNAVVRSNIAHGVLELTLQPSGWAFRFLSTDGSFSDQGRGTCH